MGAFIVAPTCAVAWASAWVPLPWVQRLPPHTIMADPHADIRPAISLARREADEFDHGRDSPRRVTHTLATPNRVMLTAKS